MASQSQQTDQPPGAHSPLRVPLTSLYPVFLHWSMIWVWFCLPHQIGVSRGPRLGARPGTLWLHPTWLNSPPLLSRTVSNTSEAELR